MAKPTQQVPILMYHSISNGDSPTCISPGKFRTQMAMIAEHGWRVIPLRDVLLWHEGQIELPDKAMAITFDDGFVDYQRSAHPVLEERKFPSTMFVPTLKVGEKEDWIGAGVPPRSVMDWQDVVELDKTRAEFAPHSRTHADLTTLSAMHCLDEVAGSKNDMETELDRQVEYFAAPYGRTNEAVQKTIAKHYTLAVGVEHGIATRDSDILNLPRIEMYYYQNTKHWGDFLSGNGARYLTTRQMLRKLRRRLSGGESYAS